VVELFVAFLLILLNGVFALSELALVSSRKPRLRALAEQRRPGAGTALRLSEDPGRFLSTVQIGITLVGILAGAFSGAALSEKLDTILEGWGVPTRLAEPLGYALVIGAITYLSVIIGELVPKQLALRNPERIACLVSRPMAALSLAAAPVIWLLDASTRLVFRMIGVTGAGEASVTEQDLRAIVAEAESAGVIEEDERSMIAGVLRLGGRNVTGVMTPRTDVECLSLSLPAEDLRTMLVDSRHSRLPVYDGEADNVVGIVQVRDVLAGLMTSPDFALHMVVREAPVVPDTIDALDVLDVLRRAAIPLALVHDEYGHFLGIVTPSDILDAIAGAFRSDQLDDSEEAVHREDGSWLLAGSMPADEMADHLNISLPDERHYQTVAGFVIDRMERIPQVAEGFKDFGWHFEVVDLDGHRIDKVLATPSETEAA
jgi:putative hemolysin